MTSTAAFEAAWLIPALPLFGAMFLFTFNRRVKAAAGGIATTLMAASFGIALWTFFSLLQHPSGERKFVQTLYTFIESGRFGVDVAYRIDPLSMIMILVVTGVATLIHLYSIGYMHGDEREHRYFAFLNLFVFSMLVLVMANNFLLLYVGWELVGLCSYLLIGFWYDREGVAPAAKKAFITNRVGDVGFALGIMLIFVHFGSLDFDVVFGAVDGLGGGAATAITLLLLVGAVGKSAQIPLYVWLPDAMAGPTPVSALIHAATMVTAGVYMVARSHHLFDVSAVTSEVVAWIGLATALLAALIALTQDDIKRILAYSTVSQLGFMFVALGVGAYPAAIFHLFTHAFFKALMFLGAGSVMHGLHDETDVTKMGGLRRLMPWTAFTFILGWLAIIGFPGFAGFFSKDQILAGAYEHNQIMWILGMVATLLTGFYMSRLVFLTFFGKYRGPEHVKAHESPAVMIWPLALLGIASVGAGWLGITPHDGKFQRFVAPSLPHCVEIPRALTNSHDPCVDLNGRSSELDRPRPNMREQLRGVDYLVVPKSAEHHGGLSELALGAIATGAGLLGAAAAGFMYLGRFPWRQRRENPSLLWRASRNKFYVDDVYQFLFTGVGKAVAATAAFVVDRRIIDGAVNGVARGVGLLAVGGRRLQTGLVRNYAAGLLGGAVLLAVLLVVRVR